MQKKFEKTEIINAVKTTNTGFDKPASDLKVAFSEIEYWLKYEFPNDPKIKHPAGKLKILADKHNKAIETFRAFVQPDRLDDFDAAYERFYFKTEDSNKRYYKYGSLPANKAAEKALKHIKEILQFADQEFPDHNLIALLDKKTKPDDSTSTITLDQIKKLILDNSTNVWSTPTDENTIIFNNNPKLQIKSKGQAGNLFTEPWWPKKNDCQLYDYEIIYDNNLIQTITLTSFDNGYAMLPSPINNEIDSFKYRIAIIILDAEKPDGSVLTSNHIKELGFKVI